MRILIADHHPQVRAALCLLLQYEPGLHIVGQASGVEMLLAQLPLAQPEIVLLESELPGLPLVEVLANLHSFNAQINVVIMSCQSEFQEIGFVAPVVGFISKREPPERLLTILRSYNKQEHKVAPYI